MRHARSPLTTALVRCRRVLRTLLPIALLGTLGVVWAAAAHAAFDHRHGVWDALLREHVVLSLDGNASALRYAALQARPDALRTHLASVSAVTAPQYAGWSRAQKLAFLINAYNAFTVELILTQYPNIKSIKDLG